SLPKGDARNGNGASSLSPDLEFWINPRGRWVLRGGVGGTAPTNETPIKGRLQAVNPWTGSNALLASFTTTEWYVLSGLELPLFGPSRLATQSIAQLIKSFSARLVEPGLRRDGVDPWEAADEDGALWPSERRGETLPWVSVDLDDRIDSVARCPRPGNTTPA